MHKKMTILKKLSEYDKLNRTDENIFKKHKVCYLVRCYIYILLLDNLHTTIFNEGLVIVLCVHQFFFDPWSCSRKKTLTITANNASTSVFSVNLKQISKSSSFS